jgi:TRAP-type mannitol/chloroaromatic compound transport system permease small subunit
VLDGLAAIARAIDRLNHAVGRVAMWLALAMVLTQFAVVLLRYVFGLGFILLQEAVIYFHAVLFLLGAGYTLLHDGHVRVDILYRGASPRGRALVNLLGALFFLMPVCALIGLTALPYVEVSWGALEGSKETSGIPGVFVLKSFILVFVLLVGLEGVSLVLKNLLFLLGRPTPLGRPPGEA